MERHLLTPLVQPQAFGKTQQNVFHQFWNFVSSVLSDSLSRQRTIQCSRAWSPSAYSTFQGQDVPAPSPRRQEGSFPVGTHPLVQTTSESLLHGCQKSERDIGSQDSQNENGRLAAYMTKQDAIPLSFPHLIRRNPRPEEPPGQQTFLEPNQK